MWPSSRGPPTDPMTAPLQGFRLAEYGVVALSTLAIAANRLRVGRPPRACHRLRERADRRGRPAAARAGGRGTAGAAQCLCGGRPRAACRRARSARTAPVQYRDPDRRMHLVGRARGHRTLQDPLSARLRRGVVAAPRVDVARCARRAARGRADLRAHGAAAERDRTRVDGAAADGDRAAPVPGRASGGRLRRQRDAPAGSAAGRVDAPLRLRRHPVRMGGHAARCGLGVHGELPARRRGRGQVHELVLRRARVPSALRARAAPRASRTGASPASRSSRRRRWRCSRPARSTSSRCGRPFSWPRSISRWSSRAHRERGRASWSRWRSWLPVRCRRRPSPYSGSRRSCSTCCGSRVRSAHASGSAPRPCCWSRPPASSPSGRTPTHGGEPEIPSFRS